MILTVGGEKGGAGKTTIATNIATMRTIEKHDLLLVDADRQPHTTYWAQQRDQNDLKPRVNSVQKTGAGLRNEILALKEKYSEIVIDVGGRDSPELRASLLVSDVAVIPLRPSQFDLWTLDKLNRLVGEVKDVNEKLRVLICLNQAPTNPSIKETKEAIEFFNSSDFQNLTLLSSIIYERIVFRKVALQGMSVHEAQIDPKAELQLNNLYKEIYNDE